MLNALAKRIYDFNVTMGWHSTAPDLARYLMNLHAEVSELWEAWRLGKVVNRYCRPNLIGGCLIHADKNIGVDGVCDIGRSKPEVAEFCDKAAKMSDPLTCIEEELADILIRTLDTAHVHGVDIDRAVSIKMAYNATRGHRYGGKLA